MPTRTKRILTACLVAAIAVATSGCQTVKGLGKDIQTASEKTEEAISK